jgi:FkbM family methyltransferase
VNATLALLMAAVRPARRRRYLGRALQTETLAPSDFIRIAKSFGITSVEAAYLDRYRVRLDVNARSITEAVLATGSFQADLFEAFARNLPDRATAFVNVGANVGTTCLNAHHAGFRDILACEPVTANFALLQDNLRQLADTKLTLHPVALGAKAEARRIFLNPESTGRHSLVRDFGQGGQSVRVSTLDEIAPARPGVLWIDAEGYEAEILRGATGFLRDHCVAMCLEITPELLGDGDLEFIDRVGRAHFGRVLSLDGRTGSCVLDLDTLREGQQTDVIFLR